MSRRIIPRIALVGVVALALAGCVRLQADLRLNADDTVDGSIIVAVVVGDGESARDEAKSAAQLIEEQVFSGLRDADGVTRSDYDEDGHLGSRFEFDDTPIDAFGSDSDSDSGPGAMRIVRDGDEYRFTGFLDLTPGDDDQVAEGDDTSNITVTVTFPGPVSESNGDVTGNTVRWSTTVEARVEMEARGSAVPTGPAAWVWWIGDAALLAVIAVAVTLVLLARHRAARPALTPDA